MIISEKGIQKLNQEEYYDSIAQSHINATGNANGNATGNANVFIVFMLKSINSSLEKLPRK